MERVAEPDLMDEETQARAYSEADFAEAHDSFVELLSQKLEISSVSGLVLDLGCGPADVLIRFARKHPDSRVIGVDGSAPMIELGRERLTGEKNLADRVELIQAFLPSDSIPCLNYTVIMSNSLLHHLRDPLVLWNEIKILGDAGTSVFVMDLIRPDTPEEASVLVAQSAADEPEVLKKDFYNSLLAAYTPAEVVEQLKAAELETLKVQVASDRHMIIYGSL